MPHGPINLSGYLRGWSQVYTSTNGGSSWNTGTVGEPRFTVMRMSRPASTNNPVRADGTRRPSNWTAIGGRYASAVTGATIFTDSLNPLRLRRKVGHYQPYVNNSGVIGTIPTPNPNLKQDNMNKTLAQYTARSVQLNTFLREAGNTAKMVANAATTLARGTNRVLGGLRPAPQPARYWKEIPGKYLEFLYGWKPLADDVSVAFTELAAMRDAGMEYEMILRGTRKDSNKQVVVNNGFGSDMMCRDTYLIEQREACGFSFKFPAWFADSLPVVSPFGNLYEQTRYSFIADWFLPIGDWVGAMESMQLNPFFAGGWSSSLLRRSVMECRFSQEDNPFVYQTAGSIAVTGHDYHYTRSVITSLWGAIALPDLRAPLSLDKASQGLSVLAQTLKKWA